MACKHGLGAWVDDTIALTKDSDCKPTEHEVNMLARMCDDERLKRESLPSFLGKAQRDCIEDGDYESVKKLRRVGIYSKVSAMLHKKCKFALKRGSKS